MSEVEPLIGWYGGKTQRPPNDSGKFNLSENFSLTFTAEIGDAGRYYCDVSNDDGIKIGGYTDVTVAGTFYINSYLGVGPTTACREIHTQRNCEIPKSIFDSRSEFYNMFPCVTYKYTTK